MTNPSRPAAMPSEEEIARVIATQWSIYHFDRPSDATWKDHLVEARAILALFAPILAEKEREVAAALDSHDAWATSWSAKLDAAEARALAAESALAAAREEGARAAVQQIASVAVAVGSQAAVGASETAGLIVSVLAANPELTERFMAEGSELFIDGTMRPENGCLSHMAMNGQVVSPTKLRTLKGQSQ